MIKKLIVAIARLFSKCREAYDVDFTTVKLNQKQDPKDARDFVQAELPGIAKSIDYSEFNPSIKYQGGIGSCGSHAAVTALEILLNMKNKDLSIPLSEMDHYYFVRKLDYENTFPKDSGQHGRNAMKLIQKRGVAPEGMYPYETSKFNDGPKWPSMAKSLAHFWKITYYERCFSLKAIKSALDSKKIIWFGIPIKRSFQLVKDDKIIKYNKDERSVGGHAVVVLGYDDKKKALKIANSWGLKWGAKGYGFIDYDYIYKCKWFDAWSMDIEVKHK